jgi:ABC-type Fe3+ transport system permease subunit
MQTEAPPAPIVKLIPDELETPPLGLGELTWRRFRRHKWPVRRHPIFLLFVIVWRRADLHGSYANFATTSLRLQPLGEHPLARTPLEGCPGPHHLWRQISLMIGLMAVLIETVVGVLVGALAGYHGGRLDSLLMRITEAMLNIPKSFC